jgi:hypothetical protein
VLKHMPTLDAPPVACGKSAWSGGPHLTVAYAFDEGSLEGPSRLAPRLSAFRDDGTAAENSDQLPLLLVHVFAPGCMWNCGARESIFRPLSECPQANWLCLPQLFRCRRASKWASAEIRRVEWADAVFSALIRGFDIEISRGIG